MRRNRRRQAPASVYFAASPLSSCCGSSPESRLALAIKIRRQTRLNRSACQLAGTSAAPRAAASCGIVPCCQQTRTILPAYSRPGEFAGQSVKLILAKIVVDGQLQPLGQRCDGELRPAAVLRRLGGKDEVRRGKRLGPVGRFLEEPVQSEFARSAPGAVNPSDNASSAGFSACRIMRTTRGVLGVASSALAGSIDITVSSAMIKRVDFGTMSAPLRWAVVSRK